MPGLDPSQLSHNWKSLQQTLEPSKNRKRAIKVVPQRKTPKMKPCAKRPYHDEVNIGLHPTHKLGRYVALDCEMVGAGPPPYRDHVLARVSLVNFHGEEIYDSYVQPPAGVVIGNYRTAVSGIEPHHLSADVARPFEEVRAQVAELIRQRILIGHGVRNDLSVLQLTHPWGCIRDTSLFRKFIRENGGKKPALRDLVRRELGLSIQNGEHCSIEDARATMLLYVKEKVAFEEDCRRLFGAPLKGVEESIEDEEEEDDDEGEVEYEEATVKKKKRKQKKRTKR